MIYDTSYLLSREDILPGSIPYTVVQELEHIKSEYSLRGMLARKRIRECSDGTLDVVMVNEKKVQKLLKRYKMIDNNDSRIIVESYLINPYKYFMTQDIAQSILSKTVFPDRPVELSSEELEGAPEIDYRGWETIHSTEENIYQIMDNPQVNRFHLERNEYAIVESGTKTSLLRWDGNQYVNLSYKPIKNPVFGTIKPLDKQQEMAFDMLQNHNITVKMCLGPYGTGKTFLMVSHAIDAVLSGRFEKIIYVRNNIQLKNTKDIGSLPGDQLSKIFPFLMPIADHLGGTEGLMEMIDNHIIEPIHLGFIRGRDLKRAIVLVDEGENITVEQAQLLIGRISEGSELWIAGDIRQCDSLTFEKNSGIVGIISCLKGNPLFGVVKLNESHRSQTAKLADLMDNYRLTRQ